ncbi:MAG: phosphatidylserine decarboxylase [Vicinamibacterales bacterium]
MRIDPAGWPFVLGGGVIAVAGVAVTGLPGAAPGVLLAAFCLFFFRDPHRAVPEVSSRTVLSPADGRVMFAGELVGEDPPAGTWRQVCIFLSPMNVHINRIPWGGLVRRVRYHPGRFLPAYTREAGDLNEYAEVWVEHAGQTLVFRQIVGLLARRVVCRVHEGDQVTTGQRFGVMKFGSRMDIYVPAGTTILVKPGDIVTAGITPIAMLGDVS